MKIFLRLIVFTLFFNLLLGQVSKAQQQPLFTQYMFNGLAINPAYAGSHESVSITGFYRNHWMGWDDGAGNSQTFTIHSPLAKERLALGMVISRDEIWYTNNTYAAGSFVYRIPMINGGFLSFGLQTSVNMTKIDLASLQAFAKDADPILNDVSRTTLNFGTGIYYYTERFYAGLATPHLINNRFSADNSDAKFERHYYLTSGYVFNLNNRNLKFKPNVFIKWVDDAPINMDLNANFFLFNTLWLGVSWRSFESLGFIGNIVIGNNIMAGVAFDPFNTTEAAPFHKGSMEFILNYRFKIHKDIPLTPRYF